MLARELHGRDHVRDARATRDQRRTPVDRAVPDLAGFVVDRVVAADDLPSQAGGQLGDGGFLQRESFGDCGHGTKSLTGRES